MTKLRKKVTVLHQTLFCLSLHNKNENQHDEKNILSSTKVPTPHAFSSIIPPGDLRSKEKHVSRYIHRYVFPLGSVERLIGCVPAAFARVHARRGARARTVAVPASFPRPRESAV